MLLPALRKARDSAQEVSCASNLRQIGLAYMMYMNDFKGWTWSSGPNGSANLLQRSSPGEWQSSGLLLASGYLKSPGVFHCPAAMENTTSPWEQYKAPKPAWLNPPPFADWGSDYFHRISNMNFYGPMHYPYISNNAAGEVPDGRKGVEADNPRDNTVGSSRPYHRRGWNVLYLDGTVAFLPLQINGVPVNGVPTSTGTTGLRTMSNWYKTYIDNKHP